MHQNDHNLWQQTLNMEATLSIAAMTQQKLTAKQNKAMKYR